MKLLLTSAGLKNNTIKQALADLVGKPYVELNVAYALTATVAEAGDHSWAMNDMNEVFGLGWKSFDMIDFASLPADDIAKRLDVADVLYVGGGNAHWLAQMMGTPEVKPLVEDFLSKKVYAGASAGSMLFSKHISSATALVFGEESELLITSGEVRAPFGYFDWYVRPHFKSSECTPPCDEDWIRGIAAQVEFPIYCIDDQTAVRVIGDAVDVVTEGAWLMPSVQ